MQSHSLTILYFAFERSLWKLGNLIVIISGYLNEWIQGVCFDEELDAFM